MVKVKNWKKLQRHPLSADYQDLSGRQWEVFIENVKAYGVINKRKITLYEDQIIDGWQLQRACVETNTKPEYEILKLPKGMTLNEFKLIANDLRRHEAAEVLARRIEERRNRVIDAHLNGESLRSIASKENVSEKTVRNDLAILESGAEGYAPELYKLGGSAPKNGEKLHNESATVDTEPVRKVTGKDGKTYPAKKLCDRCQRVGVVKDCEKCKEVRKAKKPKAEPVVPGDADESVWIDPAGNPVPEVARAAFAAQPSFDAAKKLIDEVRELIVATIKSPAGHYLKKRVAHFETACDNLASQFLAGKPSHVCPYCDDKSKECKCCDGVRWVPLHTYKSSPKGGK